DIYMAQDRERNHRVAFRERDAAHAHGVPALEYAHVADREADALSQRTGEQHVVLLGADLHVDDRLTLVELHGDLSGAVDLEEVGPLVAPSRAGGGGKHHSGRGPRVSAPRQRQDGGDAPPRRQRQDVDQPLAARLGGGERQPPYLFLVREPARGKKQQRRVGRGHKQPADEILVARLHAGAAAAAAPLGPVGRKRHALDVTEVRDGDDHVLALDQILILDLALLLEDGGPARRGELGFGGVELVLDNGEDALAGSQDLQIIRDLGGELVELGGNLVAAEGGEPLESQVEDRLGLLRREPRRAGFREAVTRIVDQRDQRRRGGGRPVASHQGLARRVRIGRAPDQADHLVD